MSDKAYCFRIAFSDPGSGALWEETQSHKPQTLPKTWAFASGLGFLEGLLLLASGLLLQTGRWALTGILFEAGAPNVLMNGSRSYITQHS